MDTMSKLTCSLSSTTSTPIVPAVASVDLSVTYDKWIELEALALTAEYCSTHNVTDSLAVRYVHYHALGVVLEESK